MKLRTDAAQKVSAGRFRIIHELALYVGDSASSLETAVKNAAVNGECYMEHAPKNTKILPTRFFIILFQRTNLCSSRFHFFRIRPRRRNHILIHLINLKCRRSR